MITIKQVKNIKELTDNEQNELLTNDFGDNQLPTKLHDWLLDHNFSEIGNGQFSVVYGSPTEKFVVKVNNGLYDGAYLDFIEWCKTQNSTHLPKVGKIREFGEKTYIVFIEKLEPLNIKVNGDPLELMKALHYIVDDISKKQYMSRSHYIFDILYKFFDEDWIREDFVDCCDQLAKFKKHWNIDISEFDLHIGNFMMRNKGTIVVTDPIG